MQRGGTSREERRATSQRKDANGRRCRCRFPLLRPCRGAPATTSRCPARARPPGRAAWRTPASAALAWAERAPQRGVYAPPSLRPRIEERVVLIALGRSPCCARKEATCPGWQTQGTGRERSSRRGGAVSAFIAPSATPLTSTAHPCDRRWLHRRSSVAHRASGQEQPCQLLCTHRSLLLLAPLRLRLHGRPHARRLLALLRSCVASL